jgi:hypothetical protein
MGCTVNFGLFVVLLLAQPALAGGACAEQGLISAKLMAQNHAEQGGLPGRDVLVSGAGAIIDGASRTTLTIDFGTQSLPNRPILELLLSPVEPIADESYLIVFTLGRGEGVDAKRLGAASFFPPRPGNVETFYINASAIVAEMKAKATTRAELSLTLAPAEPTQSRISAKVRVVGARLVGE